MPFPAGTRFGPYEIDSLLGSGAMGDVYRARDARLGRHLALKVLHARSGDGDTSWRFLQEARAASALNHPNIVAIYDVGRQDDVEFIAMELVEGESLRRVLDRGHLAPARAVAYAAQMAAALARAHAAGIVHRDIKPANIMVGADDRIRLLDFGVAKLSDAMRGTSIAATVTHAGTREGAVVGTLAYMSPEQAEGGAVDARSDIFSLGAVLFEMLCGRPAFRKATALATLAAIVHEPSPALDETNRDRPASLDHVVARCLRKDRERRFQTMADLEAALRDAGDALATTRAAAVPSGHRSHARQLAPWVIAVVAVAIALALTWPASTPAPAASSPPVLFRATSDAGFTVDPALSADGTMLAYASDRNGGDDLDIFVQPVAGGTPLRITTDDADEREPTFSPDGSRIVYRSDRDGGLYQISVLGGEAPRLIVPDGRRPRFSPDGRYIAYWVGSIIGFSPPPGSYKTFVVPAAGGEPREIAGFTGARFPVWSEDSTTLLVLGSNAAMPSAETYDWWRVPLAGGPPAATGTYDRFRAAGVSVSESRTAPGTWRGNAVLFSDTRSLWSLPLTPGTATAGVPARVTLGSANDVQLVASRDLAAFASYSSSANIWMLPIDADRGVATGPLQQVTEGTGPYLRATIAAGARKIAYNALTAAPTVVVRDLTTGQATDTGVSGSLYGSVISPDATRLAFESDGGVSVVAIRGGTPTRLCADCQVGEFTRDGRALVVSIGAGTSGRLVQIDTGSGVRRDLVVSDARVVNRPHFSPDNRLLAFRAGLGEDNQVKVVKLGGDVPHGHSEWIPIGDGERDLRPCGWSPNGRVLYLLSARDGYRCLYAQPIDPETGRPLGAATVVHHFHSTRWLTGRETSASTGPSNAIMAGAFVFDQTIVSSNIWLLKLGGEPVAR